MYWLRSIVIFLSITLGCSTLHTEIKPPEEILLPPEFQVTTNQDRQSLDYFYLKMADASKEARVQWWVEYRRANLWKDTEPAIACEKFAHLSEQAKFPLKRLALIRAMQYCAGVEKAPALLTLSHDDTPRWLELPELEAELAQARATHNLIAEYDLLIRLSRRLTDNEEKLKLVDKAAEVATAGGLDSKKSEALDRREKLAPRFIEKPEFKDWLSVATDFRRNRQFDQAEIFYRKILAHKSTSTAARISALRGLAYTYKTQRKKSEYLEILERLVRLTKPKGKNWASASASSHYDAISNYARALWTEDSVDKAKVILTKSIALFKGRHSRSEFEWILGRMSEEKGDYAEAVKWFQKAQLEVNPKSELQEKIAWYHAWNLRKLKRFDEALTALNIGREKSVNEFSRVRFQYWYARTQKDAGADSAAVEASYNQLIQDDPVGYYGLLAYKELKRPIQFSLSADVSKTKDSKFNDLVDTNSFNWLLAVEETDLGRQLLDDIADKLDQRDETTWIDFLRAYARAGTYQRLYERLGKIAPEQRQDILSKHPELLFPRPYLETVRAAAEQFDVPPELLFAIMRQESSFNPKARSSADAFGLMQLLPEVAAQAAPTAKVNYHEANDLFDPSVNIPLGAYHIRQLSNRFKGQFILTVASYNASEKSIRSWVKLRYKGDPIEFVEDVPYEETRGYIRLVMRNMIFYQLLSNPKGEIEFPDWVFEIKGS